MYETENVVSSGATKYPHGPTNYFLIRNFGENIAEGLRGIFAEIFEQKYSRK
jgi:hypothetical protein